VAFAEAGEDPLPSFVAPAARADPRFPLLLTNAKVVSFCHSQHRALPSLRAVCPDPEIECAAETAAHARVRDGEWAVVSTAEGSMRARVRVVAGIVADVVVATHGWWQDCSALGLPGYPSLSATGANVNALVGNRIRDRISGATALRAVPCRLEPALA
jgi:anaerobic selenocysteine-containing dehydrogenase